MRRSHTLQREENIRQSDTVLRGSVSDVLWGTVFAKAGITGDWLVYVRIMNPLQRAAIFMTMTQKEELCLKVEPHHCLAGLFLA